DQRFGLTVETLRARLDEVRRTARERTDAGPAGGHDVQPTGRGGSAPADALERELLEVLLADPMLVAAARAEVAVAEVAHAGLKRLLERLYALYDEGL